ncbi:lectin like domain-containing protein [Lachnospiraceae bacterium C1.1]|nr:lectin like domain-containing protein [Lachnospiraceae bacterium C1.1]
MFKNELIESLIWFNRDFKNGGAKGMIARHYRKGIAALMTMAMVSGLFTMPIMATEDTADESLNTEATDSVNNSDEEVEESSSDEEDSASVSEDDLPTQSDGSRPVSFSFPSEYTYKVDSSEWSGKSKFTGSLYEAVQSENESHEWAYSAMLAAADGSAADLVSALYDDPTDPLGLFNKDRTSDKTEEFGYGNAALATFVLANSTSVNGIKGQLNGAAWAPINDVAAIKGLIYKYGAAVIDTYMDMSVSSATAYRTNSENLMFTTVSDDYADPNHSIVIYGWDDSIDAADFTNRVTGNKPSSSGGFKARGLDGEDFYISYEDATFTAEANSKKRRAVAYNFSESTTYSHMYAYDGTPNVETKEVNMLANIFTASGNPGKLATRTNSKTKKKETYITTTYEAIKQVGFAVADPGSYEISIYSYPYGITEKASPFVADNLIETVDTDVNYVGYTTVKLDKPILITEGKSFAAVIRRKDGVDFDAFVSKTDTETYDWISFEDNGIDKSYSSTPYVSFYKNAIDGDTYVAGYSPRIKVFTDNVDTIKKVSANGVNVTLPHYIYKHTGKNISPKVIIEANGYLMNSDSGLFTRILVGCKDTGVGQMIVSSNTVFSSYQGVCFQIVSSKGAKMSRAKVYGVQNQALNSDKNYDQSDILLRYKLSNGSYVPLVEGVDYVVSTEFTGQNQDKKKLKMTITGKGAFRKTKTVSFRVYDNIVPMSDSSIDVTMTYEKKELENFEEVDYTGTKIKPKVTVKDTATGTELVEGTDYKVKYSKCKNPGLAKVTIKAYGSAKASYKGKVVKYFIIKPINIAGGKLTDKCSSGYRYTGSAITPSVNVAIKKKNAGNSTLSIYTTNDVSVRSKSYSTVKSRPTAYVFGSKRYTGYAGKLYYTILAATSTTSSN